jgi:hypothetical protein
MDTNDQRCHVIFAAVITMSSQGIAQFVESVTYA